MAGAQRKARAGDRRQWSRALTGADRRTRRRSAGDRRGGAWGIALRATWKWAD